MLSLSTMVSNTMPVCENILKVAQKLTIVIQLHSKYVLVMKLKSKINANISGRLWIHCY